MFGKLFALYPAPPGEDVELKVASYIEETRQVPPLVLSHALHRLVRRRGAREHDRADAFAPPVADILREAARVTREAVLTAQGRDAREYNPNHEFELNVQRWLPECARAEAVLQGLALPPASTREAIPAAFSEVLERQAEARKRPEYELELRRAEKEPAF